MTESLSSIITELRQWEKQQSQHLYHYQAKILVLDNNQWMDENFQWTRYDRQCVSETLQFKHIHYHTNTHILTLLFGKESFNDIVKDNDIWDLQITNEDHQDVISFYKKKPLYRPLKYVFTRRRVNPSS